MHGKRNEEKQRAKQFKINLHQKKNWTTTDTWLMADGNFWTDARKWCETIQCERMQILFCLDRPGRSNDWAAQSVWMANTLHTNGSPLETANHKEYFCVRGHNFIFVVFFPVIFKSCYCLDKNLPVFKCPDYYFFAFQTVSTLATRGVKN